jgi:pyridoxal phosphate enzyme (YggS family)
MSEPNTTLDSLRQQLRAAEQRYQREAGSVSILAVSKAKSAEDIRTLAEAGQVDFGENYLQEALGKQSALSSLPLTWHYIGQIQSNKTADIAHNFDWVHSVDRLKIAQRLSQQRPDDLAPLQICLQVNLQNEPGKAGVSATAAGQLASAVTRLPNVQLRGLMAIPQPSNDFSAQRAVFAELRILLEQINAEGLAMDTLSMGMSADWEAAVAEGATWIRIGTALFGPR